MTSDRVPRISRSVVWFRMATTIRILRGIPDESGGVPAVDLFASFQSAKSGDLP